MMNALRLPQGFEKALYQLHTGEPLTSIAHILDSAEKEGLLMQDGEIIQATTLGYDHLNTLLEKFMHEKPRTVIPVVSVEK